MLPRDFHPLYAKPLASSNRHPQYGTMVTTHSSRRDADGPSAAVVTAAKPAPVILHPRPGQPNAVLRPCRKPAMTMPQPRTKGARSKRETRGRRRTASPVKEISCRATDPSIRRTVGRSKLRSDLQERRGTSERAWQDAWPAATRRSYPPASSPGDGEMRAAVLIYSHFFFFLSAFSGSYFSFQILHADRSATSPQGQAVRQGSHSSAQILPGTGNRRRRRRRVTPAAARSSPHEQRRRRRASRPAGRISRCGRPREPGGMAVAAQGVLDAILGTLSST